MKLEEYRYIVVEGPIGVGKTSLARRIADHAPLRKCAFRQRIHVAFAVTDVGKPAGKLGRLHHPDQVLRKHLAGILWTCAPHVGPATFGAVEVPPLA